MNFLEFAKLNNKIKNLDEILFESLEYDDYNLYECGVNYNNYLIGDLVFVQKYKYKNGKLGRNHIFLIVDISIKNENVLYYGMILSSKVEKISYKANKLICKNSENNLRKDSIIKTDVIYKIFTKNILLKIGKIDKTKVEIYKNCLIKNI